MVLKCDLGLEEKAEIADRIYFIFMDIKPTGYIRHKRKLKKY